MKTAANMRYREVCHVDPWEKPRGTIVLVHGVAECSLAWSACVPGLSRHYRVIVPDLPGCGETPAQEGRSSWSMAALSDLLAEFASRALISDVHLVGAKFGGTLALYMAAKYPDLVRTLTVLDFHASAHGTTGTASARERIGRDGIRRWVAETMPARLGTDAPPEKISWWIDYMASADTDATLALMSAVDDFELERVLRAVRARTLLLMTRNSPVASAEAMERWASLMANAAVDVVDGNAFHMAAAYPDLTARRIRSFIDQHLGFSQVGA